MLIGIYNWMANLLWRDERAKMAEERSRESERGRNEAKIAEAHNDYNSDDRDFNQFKWEKTLYEIIQHYFNKNHQMWYMNVERTRQTMTMIIILNPRICMAQSVSQSASLCYSKIVVLILGIFSINFSEKTRIRQKKAENLLA